jgi:hypothetical protein
VPLGIFGAWIDTLLRMYRFEKELKARNENTCYNTPVDVRRRDSLVVTEMNFEFLEPLQVCFEIEQRLFGQMNRLIRTRPLATAWNAGSHIYASQSVWKDPNKHKAAFDTFYGTHSSIWDQAGLIPA